MTTPPDKAFAKATATAKRRVKSEDDMSDAEFDAMQEANGQAERAIGRANEQQIAKNRAAKRKRKQPHLPYARRPGRD